VKRRGNTGSAAALFLLGLLTAALAGAATFRVSPIQLSLNGVEHERAPDDLQREL
jgi:hypothetical protein